MFILLSKNKRTHLTLLSSIISTVYYNVSSRAEALPFLRWSFRVCSSLSFCRALISFCCFIYLVGPCQVFSFLFLLVICILVLLPFGFSSSPSFQLLSFLSAFVLSRMLVYRGTPTHLTRRSIPSTRPTLSHACRARARTRPRLPLL